MAPLKSSEVSRREFLVHVGVGTYGLLRGGSAFAAPLFPTRRASGRPKLFKPIGPFTEDALHVPAGFKAERLLSFGDLLGSTGPQGPEAFGSDNDFLAYFPIDALSGGKNGREGLLWVNHESLHSLLVSGVKASEKTEAMMEKEKLVVGGSVVKVARSPGPKGNWKFVKDASANHRYTALYPEILMTGPAKERVPTGIGTLANCSGGVTPWNTVLTCEENFHLCNTDFGWGRFDSTKIDENQYGWIVEIDPFQKMPPRKHSCLGRFAHENAAMRYGRNGHLAVYMGDDSRDQFFYKFVSAEKKASGVSREQARSQLENGTLYAADFLNNRWLPLDIEKNPKLKEAGFKSQAEVLVETRRAAAAAGATPMDRPEDCEVHPKDGSIYIAFTNNSNHGNSYGQIVRLVEKDDDAEALEFRYEIFLTGGPQSGLAAPDNLCFDKDGNLWVCCDISTSDIHKSAYKDFGNNGMYFVPTSGRDAGTAYQFASAPVDAELTGPWFTPGFDTLFLSVQHPGEGTTDLSKLTSHWPEGGTAKPKSSVVAITGF